MTREDINLTDNVANITGSVTLSKGQYEELRPVIEIQLRIQETMGEDAKLRYVVNKNGVWLADGIDVNAAVDKQIAEKPKRDVNWLNGKCPVCNAELDIETAEKKLTPKFCWNCGQAIDFTEEG